MWESSFLGASPRQSSPVGGWGGSAALIPSLPPPSPCVLMAREPSARPHRDQLSGKAKPWDVPQARRPVTLDNPGQSLAFLQSQFITCRQKYTLFLYSILFMVPALFLSTKTVLASMTPMGWIQP